MDKGRGGKGRSPSSNTRRLSRERLREHLEETKLIDELGWVCPAGSLETTGLNSSLARKNIIDSEACPCDNTTEQGQDHALWDCPSFTKKRRGLSKALKHDPPFQVYEFLIEPSIKTVSHIFRFFKSVKMEI